MKGFGNEQDYGMRIYDPRIGRFFSEDPLTKKYPWYTPYQFAGNKPIKYVDVDGAEENDEDLELREEERDEELRRAEAEELARALKHETPEERAARQREAEEYFRQIKRGGRNYGRNAFSAMEELYRSEQQFEPFRQYIKQNLQLQTNRANAKAFEQVVNTQLRASNNVLVGRQITLVVTGQLNGRNVEVRIRIDNVTNNNGVINLYEAKFSVVSITSNNYTRTLTEKQSIAFELFTQGKGVNISAVGENARQAGLKPGENITGKISDIKVVTNSTSNPSSNQTQTVKTINVQSSAAFRKK